MNLRALIPLLLCFVLPALHAAPVRHGPVEAELLLEHSALTAGTTNTVALRLRPDPQWHVYWRNPGDSGIPTALEWSLPAGIEAGAIEWPYPHMQHLGELTNYGYEQETLHLIPLTVAASSRGPVTLRAKAKWLVCKDICIPGSADLELPTTVTSATTTLDPDWAPSFATTRTQLPRAAKDWQGAFQIADGALSLSLQVPALTDVGRIEFFPYANDLVDHAATQRIERDGDQLRLSQASSAYFVDAPATVDGVLVLYRGHRGEAWSFSAQPGAVTPVAAPASEARPLPPSVTESSETTSPAVPPSLLAVLLFALLGGLILNLMPCVFPVLSLKALAMAQTAADQPQARKAQALAYTAGVVLSCVAVAALMLGLRSAGEAVGWGFQLQSPIFIGLLVYILFALGLSLSGVAQFGIGVMNLGGKLTQRPGNSGAFFTGVLAVVVATPCTAPFMGTALGYAMTQPSWVALSVFAVLGLGLALPFLLLGWIPGLARLLPRPGAWMERFKQVMAFPLYLTVVWLLWVLMRQTDANVAAQAMLGLVLIAFALWLWNSRGLWPSLLKLLSLAGAAWLIFTVPGTSSPSAASTQASLPAHSEAWSSERVAQLRAEGRTIFVDFTADWCITCKVNERGALRSARVEEAFRNRDVAVLIGDWTRSDPAITAELARFGRNGVPLYLVYVNGGEPTVLPQLLTPDVVLQALH
jgi:thiol:disulfide interchange protein